MGRLLNPRSQIIFDFVFHSQELLLTFLQLTAWPLLGRDSPGTLGGHPPNTSNWQVVTYQLHLCLEPQCLDWIWVKIRCSLCDFDTSLLKTYQHIVSIPKSSESTRKRPKPFKIGLLGCFPGYGKSTYFHSGFYGLLRAKYGLCTGGFFGYVPGTYPVRISTYPVRTQKNLP